MDVLESCISMTGQVEALQESNLGLFMISIMLFYWLVEYTSVMGTHNTLCSPLILKFSNSWTQSGFPFIFYTSQGLLVLLLIL